MYTEMFEEPDLASADQIRKVLSDAASAVPGHGFSTRFLVSEWTEVVDARRIKTWEEYRDVPRLGRKTRIGGKQRQVLWSIFEKVLETLDEQGLVTWPAVFERVGNLLTMIVQRPFDFAVVDEAQDIGVPELKFLASIGKRRPDALYFSGDLGQRIFQQPFSWKALGVDIRGRSNSLKINYRTSHQIRKQADLLLPQSLADVDGNTEKRGGAISVFNGPPPLIDVFYDADEESREVGAWLAERLSDGVEPHEIGVFVRAMDQLPRAMSAIKSAGANPARLDGESEPSKNCIAAGIMHLAKGLEFKTIAVMACDDEVIPFQKRIESVTDESDLEEVYNTERHLLYVACTRARDHLLITGVDPGSEFLDDMVV